MMQHSGAHAALLGVWPEPLAAGVAADFSIFSTSIFPLYLCRPAARAQTEAPSSHQPVVHHHAGQTAAARHFLALHLSGTLCVAGQCSAACACRRGRGWQHAPTGGAWMRLDDRGGARPRSAHRTHPPHAHTHARLRAHILVHMHTDVRTHPHPHPCSTNLMGSKRGRTPSSTAAASSISSCTRRSNASGGGRAQVGRADRRAVNAALPTCCAPARPCHATMQHTSRGGGQHRPS